MFALRQLTTLEGKAEYDMLQQIGGSEYGFTNEVNGMPYEEYRRWLVQQDDYSRAQNMPEDWVPQTTYFFYADGRPVGVARIRHFSSERLERQGVGNFGYGIARPHRGKGYGHALFLEVLEKCKAHGYERVKSFVYLDNAASNRVFSTGNARCLGVFDGVKNVYEVDLSKLPARV